jgi:uncharacterized membrane protein YagU involved in acid resistance
MNRIVSGAAAGLIATAPMTAWMVAAHRRLPRRDRYPLPPHEITMNLAEEAGVRDALDSREAQKEVTLALHFGYGAAAGAAYALVAPRIPLPPAIKGGLFGLGVWTVSYLGLMPALGLHRPATDEPADRNALMISANILWGALTGVLADRMESAGKV